MLIISPREHFPILAMLLDVIGMHERFFCRHHNVSKYNANITLLHKLFVDHDFVALQ